MDTNCYTFIIISAKTRYNLASSRMHKQITCKKLCMQFLSLQCKYDLHRNDCRLVHCSQPNNRIINDNFVSYVFINKDLYNVIQ